MIVVPRRRTDKALLKAVKTALDIQGVKEGENFVIFTEKSAKQALERPEGQARRWDTQTARKAAQGIGKAGSYRRRVLECIASHADGVTSEEAVRLTGIEYRTLTPRIGELKRARMIVPKGERMGDRNAMQQVLVVTEAGRLALDMAETGVGA